MIMKMKMLHSLTGRLSCIVVLVVLAHTSPAMGQSPEIGSVLPQSTESFTTTTGGDVVLADLTGSVGTVFVFWAHSCPWIDRYEERLAAIEREFSSQGIAFVLVNSNDPIAFPEDSIESLVSQAQENDYRYSYIVDPTGQFARGVHAKRTPEVFVYDDENLLVYAGAIDDSPAIANSVVNSHLKIVLQALVDGTEIETPLTNAIGCTIKFAP